MMCHISAVGTWAGRTGVRISAVASHFLFSKTVQTSSVAHCGSNGYRSFFLGVELPGREVNHSPPSSTRLRMNGAAPPLPLYRVYTKEWCGLRVNKKFISHPTQAQLQSLIHCGSCTSCTSGSFYLTITEIIIIITEIIIII